MREVEAIIFFSTWTFLLGIGFGCFLGFVMRGRQEKRINSIKK